MRRSATRLLQIVDQAYIDKLPSASSSNARIVNQPKSSLEPKPIRLIDTLLAEQAANVDWPPNLRIEPTETEFGEGVTSAVAKRMKQLLVEEPPTNWKPKTEAREIWRAPLKRRQRKNIADRERAGESRHWVARDL